MPPLATTPVTIHRWRRLSVDFPTHCQQSDAIARDQVNPYCCARRTTVTLYNLQDKKSKVYTIYAVVWGIWDNVLRPSWSNMLPRNMLRWCKRGFMHLYRVLVSIAINWVLCRCANSMGITLSNSKFTDLDYTYKRRCILWLPINVAKYFI